MMDPVPQHPYLYIDNQPALDDLVEKLRPAHRLSLDIEANSLYHYYERVCLIQLSADGADYIIDPLSGCDLTGFLETISRKDLIFHCGDYDLRMLKQSFGFRARGRVFDTMLAAKLLGFKCFSLIDLIEHFCGHRYSKSSQKSNWTKRPLTEKQLLYASNDTHYLELICDRLEPQLRDQDRLHWHDQTVERLLDVIDQVGPQLNCNRLWRIKGTRDLHPQQMAILRDLWWWRELVASDMDRPPFKVITNEKMVWMAGWISRNRKEPEKAANPPDLPRHIDYSHREQLRIAIERALGLPSECWPERLSGDFRPDYPNDLFERLRQETARQAEPFGIDPSIIAPRSILGRIAEARPETIESMFDCAPGLLAWQARLLYEPFTRIIQNFETAKQSRK